MLGEGESRPSRTRGLKHKKVTNMEENSKSRPSRTRGLKHQFQVLDPVPAVASLADAWIETMARTVLQCTE